MSARSDYWALEVERLRECVAAAGKGLGDLEEADLFFVADSKHMTVTAQRLLEQRRRAESALSYAEWKASEP